MERIELKYKDSQDALETFKEILNEEFSIIVRDAAIQRFEYTFEAFWKFVKEYLKEKEGIIVNSPKSSFRELFGLGFVTEDETIQLLDMADKRNQTSHTYKEKVAEGIYNKIKEYFLLMEKVLNKFRDKV